MRRAALLVPLVVLSLIAGPCAFAGDTPARVRFPADVPPRNDIRVENRVPIRMRDGVTLYADVYRPAGEGRYPVIVSRTPYSTERFPSAYEAAVYFSQRGYVYVFQDIRGRHESEGRWEPFFDDEKDGYDTIEWAAKQAWSNGKVAMQGGSYLGQNQWRAAQAAPPSLVTIFPMVSSTSLYHDWITLNGGLAALVQLRLGARAPGVADHAEPGPSHGQRGARRPLRPGAVPPAPEDDAAARGAQRPLLRRLARPPRLRLLLEAAQRGGDVREDQGPGAHLRRLVRHLQPGDAARLRGHEPEGRVGRRRGA